MSGFEADWLALREPADIYARDKTLLAEAAAFIDGRDGVIVDLGCGTGSTFRTLDPRLEGKRRWRFVDHDERLLERARSLQPPETRNRIALQTSDLSALDRSVFEGAAIVTASALFDLVSKAYIERFCAILRDQNAGLYAALSVDGRIEWDEPHPLDAKIVAAFVEDQAKDKGFGPSLGGKGASVLETVLMAEGFDVRSAHSDWVLDARDLSLQDAFHDGFAGPARSRMSDEEISAWLVHRSASARSGKTVRVGHRDCVAFPPG